MSTKKIVILGSTGSIGQSTLSVVDHLHPELEVVGLAINGNLPALSQQIQKYRPKVVAVYNPKKAKELQSQFPKLKIYSGIEGVCEVAAFEGADLCVCAISGTKGIFPTFAAIESGKDLAIANKEVLVSAGSLIMQKAKEKGVKVLPIDSEQSAIFQCLQAGKKREVNRLIVTASGGPFFQTPLEKLRQITKESKLSTILPGKWVLKIPLIHRL